MKEVHIICHAQSRFSGGDSTWLDAGLTAVGRRQGELLAQHIRLNLPNVLLVSPMLLAVETAMAVLRHNSALPSTLWPLLHERLGSDMSRCAGQSRVVLLCECAGFRWMDGSPSDRWWPGTDESLDDVGVLARVLIRTLSGMGGMRCVALITHTVFACRLLKENTPAGTAGIYAHHPVPGSIARTVWGEGRRGVGIEMDDVTHLEGLQVLEGVGA